MEVPEGSSVTICPQCREPEDGSRKFCTRCGSPLYPAVPAPFFAEPASPARKGPAITKETVIAIAAGIVIILVVAAGMQVLLPEPTRSGSTQPLSADVLPGPTPPTPPAAFILPKETEPPTASESGVWIHIRYPGRWNATFGMPGALHSTEESGDRMYEIQNASGRISLTVGKRDNATSQLLAAEIVRNGIVLANSSTREAYGNITLSAEAGPVQATTPAVPVSTVPPRTNTTATTVSTLRTPVTVITAPVCPSDRSACGANCTDLMGDSTNCGLCGNSCAAGNYCLNGNCALNCTAGQDSCPDGCFNLATDPKHCGTCQNSCPNGLICSAGRCDSPATPMPVPR